MSICGKTVALRALEDSDLPQLNAWGNDADLWALLGGWTFPLSMAQTRAWYERQHNDPLNQRFAIHAPDLGLVGVANLVDIDWKNNHAFHGMLLGNPAVRGKGIGTDVIMAVMRYAFDEMHLARLDGSMIEYNTTSLHVYCEKCGWRIEGRQPNWYYRRGRYWERILVGITKADYDQLIQRTRYWGE